MRAVAAALLVAVSTAPAWSVPAGAMTVKEFFDLEAASSVRKQRSTLGRIYLDGALEAYTHANAEAQRAGQARLFCDVPGLPPHVENVRAMLRSDAAELRRALSAAEFDAFYRTTDLTHFLLTSLKKHYPCP
jgi:hypothetical protein